MLLNAVGDHIFLHHRHRWTSLDDDGFFTPKLLERFDGGDGAADSDGMDEAGEGDEEGMEEVRFFQAVGLFWRICAIWGIDCLRLSPMFMLYVLTKNKRLAIQDDFVSAVAPRLSNRLKKWPPPQQPGSSQWLISPVDDPYRMILSIWPHMEVCFSTETYSIFLRG